MKKLFGRPRPHDGPASPPPTIEQRRADFATEMAKMRVAGGITTSPSMLGGLRAVAVAPVTPARPGTILYFHGGAFILGSPETAMSLTAGLVARTSIRATSLDYRLAPEHPFPAAFDDAFAAYRELLDSGVDERSIAFAGDSSGGGLAIGTCLRARDEDLPMPAAVVTFSASLDMTRSGASMDTKEGVDPFFTKAGFALASELALAGQDPRQPVLSPATTADLTDFPPLLLQVGANEMLLDDSTRLAQRAWVAGVDVILDVTANVPHVFQAFTGFLDEADQALDRAAAFLEQHLSAPRAAPR